MSSKQHYRYSGFAYVRATTLDRPWPRPAFDFGDHDAILTRAGRSWLRRLWSRPDIRQALTVASPDLAERIEQVIGDHGTQPHRMSGLLRSVYAYLIRWERRATPYGLFAGVASATVGAEIEVRFGTEHILHRHRDAAVVCAEAERFEVDPALLAELKVCANNLAVLRGDRIAVPAAVTDEQLGRGVLAETTMRASGPVRAALALAVEPIGFNTLAEQVRDRFPTASPERVTALLTELIRAEALLSSARPTMTAFSGRTRSTIAGDGAGAVRAEAVHVGLDADVQLPRSVVEEAESAASVLARLSASPYGTPVWREYLQRFCEQYGVGALVPVRELVGDAGLGYPTGYAGAACSKGPRILADRDAALLELVQTALVDRREEIVFTDRVIDRVKVGTGADLVLPPRTELMFRIDAAGAEAIDAGRFRLRLTGIPRPESSLAGRFIPLLGDDAAERFADSYAVLAGRVVAQLTFPPRRARNGNVAAVPALLPHVIPLGEHPPETDAEIIDIDDLAVTADPTQLHLVRMSTGEIVEAHALHALDATVHTPPLARFLAEVSGAGRAWWGPVDLGIARTLPYLPRLRTGRTVLAPARWLLNAADLPGQKAPASEWDRAFETWRERWRMPDMVEFTVGDSRLPVDLTDRLDRHLLRSRLAREDKLEVAEHEPLPGWAGRPCEFVLGFRSAAGPPSPRLPPIQRAALELPGGDLIAAVLHGHPRRFDDLIRDHLPALQSDTDSHTAARWFTRSHDNARPESEHTLHLYLRLRDRSDAEKVAAALRSWAEELHRRGLITRLQLTDYRHQSGRWGGDVRVVEQVFTTDSDAALAQLGHCGSASVEAATAVSMVETAAALAPEAAEGWRWITEVIPHEEVRIERRIREEALAIEGSLRDLAPIAEAWERRRRALAAYRDAIGSSRPAETVLRSLLHEHFVRCVGVDPERERALNRIVRGLAARRLHTGGRS